MVVHVAVTVAVAVAMALSMAVAVHCDTHITSRQCVHPIYESGILAYINMT